MKTDDLNIPVVHADERAQITHVNRAFETTFRLASDEVLDRPIFEVLRPRLPDGTDLLPNGWHKSAWLPGAKRIPEHNAVLRVPEGEIDVHVDGSYLRNDDRSLSGAVLLLRRRSRGRRRPRSAIRIVSAVSHELRTPLTSVRGYTSLLLKRWDDIEDADRREMLTQIDRDARRIGRMIGELLDISRLETGNLNLNWMRVDLAPVISDICRTTAASWPDFECHVSLDTGFPDVLADPDKVTQILSNLVENACKYASPKGIDIRGKYDQTSVSIEVTDAGPGIPPGDLNGLFRQFFKSREGRPSGTGLGLWISRGLAEAHGGTLHATSVTAADSSDGDTGTTFTFSLPRLDRVPDGA